MTATVTCDDIMYIGADTIIVTGTYVMSGTSGDIVIDGLADIRFFKAISTAGTTAVKYSASSNTITITTASSDTGTWMAVGIAS